LPDETFSLIADIYNACFTIGYFPSAWKKAKIVAIPKASKDHSKPENYRPISLLSCLGKILEKLISIRLTEYLEENKLINPEQFGFRSMCSAPHQLRRLVNHVRSKFKQKKSTAFIMMDVERAFDSVWLEGLIHKLYKSNIPIHLLVIIKEFLLNRSFSVNEESSYSKIFDIPAGVPQGSTLSPLLYIFYVSDFKSPNSCNMAQFADDTAFFISGTLARAICKKLNNSVKKIFDYFHNWKIKVNTQKTELIFFTRNRKRNRVPDMSLLLSDGSSIEWSDQCKYLGVILDKRLTFKHHIDYVCSKALKQIGTYYGAINRRSRLSQQNKLLLYKTAFRSVLSYAAPVWADAAKSSLKKMQITQNKILKIILNKPYREKTSNIHLESKIPYMIDFIDKINSNFKRKLNFSNNELIRNISCL
jgi:hypothetical protein